jgi:DNA-binding transcriptional regulator YiaG
MAVLTRRTANAKQNRRAKSQPKGRPAKALAVSAKPSMIVHLRKRLQLSQAVFARMLPVSVRSLATLESGSSPSAAVARRLNELQRLTSALSEVIQQDSLGTWLQTPNAAFDGLKPLEVIDRGEIDRLWSMIYFLRSGVPS